LVAVKNISRLAGIELLAGLGEDSKINLEKRCRWRHYEAGQQILDKNSSDRDVYFVVEGAVKVVNYSMTGREIALAHLGSGGYFGELSAIDGMVRSASVVALEDCLLASLSPQIFASQLSGDHGMTVGVLGCLAGIIRSCDERIMDLSTLDAVTRVYRQLLDMAKEDPDHPGEWLITDLPTNKTIAALASTARETASRAVTELAKCDIVKRKGRTLRIPDKGRLEDLAGLLINEPPR